MIQSKPYLLENRIQHYAWGVQGNDAFIPRLLGIEAANDTPYAELWIGAHANGPSAIEIDGHQYSLDKLIEKYPEAILGKGVLKRFGRRLSFLFKVLSAGEALSIQAHPNKNQAVKLHAQDPLHYPDDNHKPEIAIALDNLTALAGLKSISVIRTMLSDYPEIAEFIGHVNDTADVKTLFSSLLKRSEAQPDALKAAIDFMANRLNKPEHILTEQESLFIELHAQYTNGDVGLFAIFFLNLIHLEAGEAIYLKAGVPHAYLKGNIVECMANSDNVVRVGLTPKYKDLTTLIEIMDCTPNAVLRLSEESDIKVYKTPADEFEVSSIVLHAGEVCSCDTHASVEVLFIISGTLAISNVNKEEVQGAEGDAFLIPAMCESYSLKAIQDVRVFRVVVPFCHGT